MRTGDLPRRLARQTAAAWRRSVRDRIAAQKHRLARPRSFCSAADGLGTVSDHAPDGRSEGPPSGAGERFARTGCEGLLRDRRAAGIHRRAEVAELLVALTLTDPPARPPTATRRR